MITVVTCTQLSLDNGGVTYNESMVMTDEYPVDTLASFSCERGYNLNGSDTSTCQTSEIGMKKLQHVIKVMKSEDDINKGSMFFFSFDYFYFLEGLNS